MENPQDIIAGFWGVLGEMSPYLLFGFFVAGVLSVLMSQRMVERHLGGRGLRPVVKAAAFGVPLPLCSCGVIPVSASLRRHGASKGATTGFLLSTPQTGVDSIMVTYSLLGPVFAVFRPVAALVSGLIGGALVAATDGGNGQAGADGPERRQDPCCTDDRHGRAQKALQYGFVTLPRDIARPLLIGLVVAALISALIPKDYFAPYLGGGVVAILILMALGIPVYVCATASIPVAYALIVNGGVSPGAAFAFLVTGPATNAATLAVVWRVLGRRTALIYLATVAAGAVAGGLILDQLVTAEAIRARAEQGMRWMMPEPVKLVCAIALLGVLAVGLFRRGVLAAGPGARGHDGQDAPTPGRTTRLHISGMTCSHCAASVQRALAECEGVETAAVDLAAGVATVSGEHYDPGALARAVEQIGYRVERRQDETHPAEGQQ